MKKVKIITIFAIIYIGLILMSTKVLAANTGKVINDSTRIREEATTSSQPVTVVSAGEKVEIISEDGEWYKVKYTKNKISYDGYIRKDMLEVSSKSDVVKEEKTEDMTTVKENVENTEKIEIKEGNKGTINQDIETRILPLISSSKADKISNSTEITITEIIGKWSYIESQKQSGWVMTSQLENNIIKQAKTEKNKNKEETKKEESTESNKNEGKILYVSSDTVNLRKEASTDSLILDQLTKNDKVTLIDDTHSTWTKVKYKNLTGYVAKQYLSDKKDGTTSRGSDETRKEKEQEQKKKQEEEKKKQEEEKKKQEEAKKKQEEKKKQEAAKKKQEEEKTKKSSSVTGDDIVAYAKKFLGCKYVHGASGPDKFDCSGFTSYVYKHFGYSLSRTSSGQRSNGKKVKKANLKPGDIVCFSGHVGIYIGGNEFIHAANPRKGVIITSLSNSYYVKTYITARRIIN